MKLNINLRNGIIAYDEFNIDPNLSLQDQIIELQEDLLQIQYDNNIVVDVGWYPELDPSGKFIIYIIKDSDWDSPLYKKVVKLKNIATELQKAIDLIPTLKTNLNLN
jgi:hypothetical protein